MHTVPFSSTASRPSRTTFTSRCSLQVLDDDEEEEDEDDDDEDDSCSEGPAAEVCGDAACCPSTCLSVCLRSVQ
jgi:hypothetical protein